MKEEKIILESDPEAATYQTGIEGWVSRGGFFHGKDEAWARITGSTHRKCQTCGNIIEKQSYCQPCHKKFEDEKYAALERVEWDGESPVCTFDGDEFFMHGGMDEVIDYCDEHGCKIEDLQLCHCEPMEMPFIDIDDLFDGHLPDLYDSDARDLVSKEVIDKINDLNALLENHEPIAWQCSDKAVNLKGGDK